MFSERTPARNIRELLDHLQEQHTRRHVYRGQTKHYGTLVPSLYRNCVEWTKKRRNVYPIDADQYDRNTGERGDMKLRELNRLIRHFGLGVGNLLAQQYGISSECVDITSNPGIAAFFAARKWPGYEHYIGSDANALGVIYRFTAIDFVSDSNGLDLTLRMAGLKHDPFPSPVWFLLAKKSSFSKEELDGVLAERENVEEVLFTHPAVVTYQLLADSVEQFFVQKQEDTQEAGLIVPEFHVAIPARLGFGCTRYARQEGGFWCLPLLGGARLRKKLMSSTWRS